ncbi:TIGR02117 family protein [Pontibacter arcticus]|uniref:TIGR02117 family protein n=1 Tax=Pontibacter arcticus TaxID=2080288 RepID=A0A364RDY5_9BACT|nr:TIGR02117 family protein [Pontibacter arcticus]RAU82455.1 TIGR02117 family protein [Pontibacter arcticus]
MISKTGKPCWQRFLTNKAENRIYGLLFCLFFSAPFTQVLARPHTALPDSVQLFVTSNGVHTELVVPVKTPFIDWRTLLPLQHFPKADSSFTHVAFGWGNRRFFIETPEWGDLKLHVALYAAFWPGTTAMHVEYIPKPLAPTKKQRPFMVSQAQYKKLIAYIKNSFRQENSRFVYIPDASYTDYDSFYEANGRYYVLKNCNYWVNAGLKEMGIKSAWWAPFPYTIMRHYR